MLLTTADVHAAAQLSSETPLERPRLNIHGPLGTAHMLSSARRFIFRTGMPLSVHEYGVRKDRATNFQTTWSDENIQVWALPAALYRPEVDESSDTSDPDTVSSRGSRFESLTSTEVAQQQAARQSIIQDMFDSSWRHDRLVESEFKDVRLPAKIFVRDPTTKELKSFNCASMSDAPDVSPNSKVQVRQPWPGSRWESLPDRRGLPHQAVSYIVRGHTQRGVFEKDRAKALGLHPGPMYGLLAAGKSVKTEDGTVITPDMVLGPSKPGRGIAIIDLPSTAFLHTLLKRPEWSDPEVMAGVDTFCWLLNGGVTPAVNSEIEALIRFMPHLQRAQHIVASPETCPNYLAMDSSAASTIRLSLISREHFFIPVHDNAKGLRSAGSRGMAGMLLNVPGISLRAAERGLVVQIEPKYQIQEQEVVLPLNTYKLVQEIPRAVLDLARVASEQTKDMPQPVTELELYDNDEPALYNKDEPEIVTLGTGSAVPSKYRNVSATLLKMPEYGNYLFDCGENTLGQLKRMYSPEVLNEVLRNMRMIWISHLHADHHLGTVSLLQAIKQVRKSNKEREDFALIADEAMIDFVRDLAGSGRTAITAGSMHHIVCRAGQNLQRKLPSGDIVPLESRYMKDKLHIRELLTSRVSHCVGAQAVSVEFVSGFRFSYSGDCRPSKNFARIGADSDVLVHEATFEDGLEGDAIAKKHSTTSEALGVAAEMRAKNVILTHFSQRYQKIPVMNHMKRPNEIHFEEGAEENRPPEPIEGDMAPSDIPLQNDDLPRERSVSPTRPVSPDVLSKMNVCIAFDFMRTRVSQIKNMYKLYPAIEALFEADLKGEAEQKAKAFAQEQIQPKGKREEKKQDKKAEKRKSDSDGDRQREKISKKAQRRMKREQDQKVDQENELRASADPPVFTKRVDSSTHPKAEEEAVPEEVSPLKIHRIAIPDTPAGKPTGTKHLELGSDMDIDDGLETEAFVDIRR